MGSKTPQTISHNHIKIKGIKMISSKTQKKTPRALNFIKQFALGHQLAVKHNNLVIIIMKEEL